MITSTEVKAEIEKFEELFANRITNINEIRDWMNSLKDIISIVTITLKVSRLTNQERKLLCNLSSIYDTLEPLVIIHNKEAMLEDILKEYYTIKDSVVDVLKWAYKYEDLYFNTELVCFEADYLDYAKECYELRPYFCDATKIEMKVDPKDFEIIKEFIDVFYKNHMKLIYRRNF